MRRFRMKIRVKLLYRDTRKFSKILREAVLFRYAATLGSVNYCSPVTLNGVRYRYTATLGILAKDR